MRMERGETRLWWQASLFKHIHRIPVWRLHLGDRQALFQVHHFQEVDQHMELDCGSSKAECGSGQGRLLYFGA